LLGALLGLYAACLWFFPALWFVVVPAALPAVDLTPWTGWMFVTESDLFILVTVGVLALRAPPARADLWPARGPGRAVLIFWAVLIFTAALAIAVAIGLCSPYGAPQSDNPYLSPWNALREAKGFAAALLLLPFLRARQRTHGDAVARFAWGMVAGLALVSLATLVERALFPGLFDFSSDYRVVSTFSSMHLGGGHIGAYVALALPFLIVGLTPPRPWSLACLGLVGPAAVYTLVVTFSRAAYAVAVIAVVVLFAGWTLAALKRPDRRAVSLIRPLLLMLLVVGGVVTAAIGSGFMSERLQTITRDFMGRDENLLSGLALMDEDLGTKLFGMGTGAFPRVRLQRNGPTGMRPSDFLVERNSDGSFLALRSGSGLFYFGQKVAIESGRTYALSFGIGGPSGAPQLVALLCDKQLLYSENCRGASARPVGDGRWTEFQGTVSTAGLGEGDLFGLIDRPVELSLFVPDHGATVFVRDIRLVGPDGRNLIANGNFARGTDHWYFTDDDHLVWRVKSQYLMVWFEGGLLGIVAFFLLVLASGNAAYRAILGGDRLAAAVAASIAAFLASSLFDFLTEAPRIGTIFTLVCFLALTASAAGQGPAIPRGAPRRPARRAQAGSSISEALGARP
jgi:hypothetical protein